MSTDNITPGTKPETPGTKPKRPGTKKSSNKNDNDSVTGYVGKEYMPPVLPIMDYPTDDTINQMIDVVKSISSDAISKKRCILEVYTALIIANGRTTHADRSFMENMADNAVIHGTTIYEKMQ